MCDRITIKEAGENLCNRIHNGAICNSIVLGVCSVNINAVFFLFDVNIFTHLLTVVTAYTHTCGASEARSNFQLEIEIKLNALEASEREIAVFFVT